MRPRFSVVYPTRHRPTFVEQALRILELQAYDDFEVIVSDNYLDRALSSEKICRESRLANVKYVVPPRPLGMTENWNHALPFATGEYVCYLTDKMFVLPEALDRVARAIDAASRPDIVTWTSDAYNPETFSDYFGPGRYFVMAAAADPTGYHRYSVRDELDRRGRADLARTELSPADYSRGKLVFGAYRRELIERILDRYSALFHNINPDYTSMILGLTEADAAIELTSSCVVSVNTDISNGRRVDSDDAAALEFIKSLGEAPEDILDGMLVPGLYASIHNAVAHDFLTLKRRFGLSFEFDPVNWLTYCYEDIFRDGRVWSDAAVEAQQKRLLQTFIEALPPESGARLQDRLASRAQPIVQRPSLARRLRRRLSHARKVGDGVAASSIYAAVLDSGDR